MIKGKNIIYPVCLTCGVRDTADSPTSFCPKGHDDWLEYRDFNVPEMKFVIKRAVKIFNLSKDELWKVFLKGKSILINQDHN